MLAKIFSTTLSYRLFDPMPLPKIIRMHRRISSTGRKLNVAIRAAAFARKIRKIPMNK